MLIYVLCHIQIPPNTCYTLVILVYTSKVQELTGNWILGTVVLPWLSGELV